MFLTPRTGHRLFLRGLDLPRQMAYPDLYDLCDLCDLYDLYDLAHVAAWEPYTLHELVGLFPGLDLTCTVRHPPQALRTAGHCRPVE